MPTRREAEPLLLKMVGEEEEEKMEAGLGREALGQWERSGGGSVLPKQNEGLSRKMFSASLRFSKMGRMNRTQNQPRLCVFLFCNLICAHLSRKHSFK